jgi:hypothetical protein
MLCADSFFHCSWCATDVTADFRCKQTLTSTKVSQTRPILPRPDHFRFCRLDSSLRLFGLLLGYSGQLIAGRH